MSLTPRKVVLVRMRASERQLLAGKGQSSRLASGTDCGARQRWPFWNHTQHYTTRFHSSCESVPVQTGVSCDGRHTQCYPRMSHSGGFLGC